MVKPQIVKKRDNKIEIILASSRIYTLIHIHVDEVVKWFVF